MVLAEARPINRAEHSPKERRNASADARVLTMKRQFSRTIDISKPSAIIHRFRALNPNPEVQRWIRAFENAETLRTTEGTESLIQMMELSFRIAAAEIVTIQMLSAAGAQCHGFVTRNSCLIGNCTNLEDP